MGDDGVWLRRRLGQRHTRAAIFDAIERKEVYGATGPPMVVRFFGGWDFQPGDASTRSPAEIGCVKGVPMGGDPARGDASSRHRSKPATATFNDNLNQQVELLPPASRVIYRLERLCTPGLTPSASAKSP